MWVNLKLQLAWKVCVLRRPIHAKWETLQMWSLHAKMGTAQKQGSKPDSSDTRPRVSLFTLSSAYLLFNIVGKKKSARITDPISTKGTENKHWYESL